MKTLFRLLLLLLITTFTFGNIEEYGRIKNLELSLEKRIADELRVYINSPFGVSVKIVTSKVNRGNGTIDSKWSGDDVALPGVFSGTPEVEPSNLSGEAGTYIDHIRVTIDIDEGANQVEVDMATQIAIEKAELKENRGDKVFIKRRKISKEGTVGEKLRNLSGTMKELEKKKKENEDLEDRIKRTLKKIENGREVEKIKTIQKQQELLSQMARLSQDLDSKINLLGEDIDRKIEILNRANKRLLDNESDKNDKKILVLKDELDKTYGASNENFEKTKMQLFYWMLAVLIAFLIISYIIYFLTNGQQKNMKENLISKMEGLIAANKSRDTSSKSNKGGTQDKGKDLKGESIVKDLYYLVNTRKVGVMNFIKESLKTESGQEKMAILVSQVGMRTLETLFGGQDESVIVGLRKAKDDYPLPVDSQLSEAVDSLVHEIMLVTNDLYNVKNKINPFEFLKNLPDEQIMLIMEDEDIGTKALVISQIEVLQSARIMEKLDVDEKVSISLEMSSMKPLGEAGYSKLGERLAEKLIRIPSINNFVVDGTDEMVNRLLMMTPVEQEMMIKKLKTQDPKLYGKIRDNYLFFNDIDKLDNNTAKEVMLGIDESVLAIVIATSGNAIKEYLMGLMNERKRAMVDEKLRDNGKIAGDSDSSREARAEFVSYATKVAKLRGVEFGDLHKVNSTFNSSAIEEENQLS
ncbi:MAG: hypothetical protein OIF32_08840 [Campylobacterales bacterium]|nr:hypothetical protein [Campylobacterales bacterium]